MIAQIFEKHFGIRPTAQYKTPGRVNLIGEHTDYNGGMVLPTIIDNAIEVAIAPSPTGEDQFYSEGYGAAPVEAADAPLDPDSWWGYAKGALQWARKRSDQDAFQSIGPVAVAFRSTIPAGSGLSSSAAMLVGIFKSLREMKLLSLDDVEIALGAQYIENHYMGVPCGIMDQMAVSVGQENMALALDTASLKYQHAPLSQSHDFAVVHSGISRKLTDGRYKERRIDCEHARDALGVDALCTINDEQFARLEDLPENQCKRARHAVTEHRRVVKAVQVLNAGDMEEFGQLMNQSHSSYRDDFEASTPEIDALVEGAKAYGAVGARLTGGGFGGCIVACIEKDKRVAWEKKLSENSPDITIIC